MATDELIIETDFIHLLQEPDLESPPAEPFLKEEAQRFAPYSRFQTHQWQAQLNKHESELRPIIEPHLSRAARNEKHPVLDFLFRYYSFRPQQLLRWTPGSGIILCNASSRDFPDSLGFRPVPEGRALDLARFPKKRVPFLWWVFRLNRELLIRQPRFSCFGLHEWAMLYRSGEPRHETIPLRVSTSTIEQVVESHPLTCTHFDAFRFFSPEAAPRNGITLTRLTSATHEQPGCLHASMDLYKSCYKLYPWVSSTLLRASFLLAKRARIVDMEASPYDVRPLGYNSIPIETESGKALYIEHQRTIHDEAQTIRQRLVDELRFLIKEISSLSQSTNQPSSELESVELEGLEEHLD